MALEPFRFAHLAAFNAAYVQPLCNRLCLGKQQEIVRTTRLGICAAHVEAAKRVRAHHGAGALAVQVQVAHMELFTRALEVFP